MTNVGKGRVLRVSATSLHITNVHTVKLFLAASRGNILNFKRNPSAGRDMYGRWETFANIALYVENGTRPNMEH